MSHYPATPAFLRTATSFDKDYAQRIDDVIRCGCVQETPQERPDTFTTLIRFCEKQAERLRADAIDLPASDTHNWMAGEFERIKDELEWVYLDRLNPGELRHLCQQYAAQGKTNEKVERLMAGKAPIWPATKTHYPKKP